MDKNAIDRVSKEFSVEKESLAKMVSFYEEIKEDIKGQYLAHLKAIFKMDKNAIDRVSKEFNVEKESVAKIVSFYKEIKEDIKGQYLAHLVRALEGRMRELTKNPFFRIIIRPSSLDGVEQGTSKAIYKKGCHFFIGYPKDFSDKKKRVYIAHELGHLYFLSTKKYFGIRKNDEQTEPLATIFGMLAILDKDEFYLSVANKGLLHSDLDKVIEGFKEISHTE